MKHILIATDGEPCSQEAVRHFLEVLPGQPTEITVLTVIRPSALGGAAEEELGRADQALEGAVLELASGGVHVRTRTRVGEPAEVILAAARDIAADLIVLGTRGPEGLAAFTSPGVEDRSVAEAVLHDAPCGVLIYPMRAGHLAAR